MRIFMLETRKGSEDGFVVRQFEKHHTYEVADTLARMFLGKSWAINAEEPSDVEEYMKKWNIGTASELGWL